MFKDLLYRLRSLLRRQKAEQELSDELLFHFDKQVESYIGRGLPREEAERRARISLGGFEQVKEECREARGIGLLDQMWADIRYGYRTLRRSPAFVVAACLILSLGIGLNLTFFQVLNVTVLQPLPVDDPYTLVRFRYRTETLTSSSVAYPVTQFVRHNNSVLAAVLTSTGQPVVWGDNAADRLSAAFVSANWFRELGYDAALGRVFTEAIDEQPDASPVVVLSHEFWRTRLDADPNIVGRTVRVNDRPVVVIGVASAGFPSLRLEDPRIWIPIHQIDYFNPGSDFKDTWSSTNTVMYGRLRAGSSPNAVRDRLRTLLSQLAQQRPDEFQGNEWLQPVLGSVRFRSADDRKELWLMASLVGGLVLLVLVIACANLSNLVLLRSVGRVRELGIRISLGASRVRVVRQLLTEIFLLALVGSTGGLLLSHWGAQLFGGLTGLPGYLDFVPDWRTMLASVGFALLTMGIVGLLPVWKVVREDLSTAMKDGGQQTSAGLGRTRLRQVLVGSQVAGCCLLLVVTVLMVRGLYRLLTVDRGFEFQNVAVLDPSLSQYGIKGAAAHAYWTEVKNALASHPEVESMALTSSAPLGSNIRGTEHREDAPGLRVSVLEVDEEFFSTMRVPILLGRPFGASDDPQTSVIVSRRLANRMYGSLDVIGNGFPKTNPGRTIVGVAGDAPLLRYERTGAAEEYYPLDANELSGVRLIARAKTDPEILLAPMRRAARDADKRVLAESRLMRADFDGKMERFRLARSVLGLISVLALVLTCLGVFGFVSYWAKLRTKEIGIRVALGAQRASIVQILLRQLTLPLLSGVILGMAGAAPAGRMLGREPFYLEPPDFSVNAAAVVVIVVTAGIAAILPSFAAARADPLRALKHE